MERAEEKNWRIAPAQLTAFFAIAAKKIGGRPRKCAGPCYCSHNNPFIECRLQRPKYFCSTFWCDPFIITN
jgi:hypothetical protein